MKFFHLIPHETNFDFIGKFKYFLVFSVVTILATIVGMFTKGLNYGIDFTGGTVMQVKFVKPTDTEQVRKLATDAGAADATVQALESNNTEYLITTRLHSTAKKKHATAAPEAAKAEATPPGQVEKTPVAGAGEEVAAETFSSKLISLAGPDNLKIMSLDVVGPKVGQELKLAALRSLFYTIMIIIIYIWLRFDFRFAPGATVAMVHDLMMCTGFYMLTGKEFTITAVAALLTIAGYSVNDTIVIYDRVREMFKKGATTQPLGEVINHALNVTLSRTLLTSGVTLISVLPLIFFAGGEIRDFAIAMVFGIFVGTYSTIYVASPMTIWVEHFMEKKNPKDVRGKRPLPVG